MLTLPGPGHIRSGYHVSHHEHSENLRIQLVDLLGGLGDDFQLVGVRQYDLLGEPFHQLDERAIAGSGLNHHLERLERPEKLDNLLGLFAAQSLLRQDAQFVAHHADRDNLLVEVNADRAHFRAPISGNKRKGVNDSSLPQPQRFCKTAASTSLSYFHLSAFQDTQHPPTLEHSCMVDAPRLESASALPPSAFG
jgi:hypothetical protein